MDGRKVFSRYYPPDFDPNKLKAAAKSLSKKGPRQFASKFMEIRFMWPFTFQCTNCNEFNFVGTKINSRVSKSKSEDYLGLAIWVFHNKCTSCKGEVIFKTDPKHTDYVMVSGGKRFYTPEPQEIKEADSSDSDSFEDPMRALEAKTNTTAEAVASLEALDKLRTLNKSRLHREQASDAALERIHRDRLDTEMETIKIYEDEMNMGGALEEMKHNIAKRATPADLVAVVKTERDRKTKKSQIIINTDLSQPLFIHKGSNCITENNTEHTEDIKKHINDEGTYIYDEECSVSNKNGPQNNEKKGNTEKVENNGKMENIEIKSNKTNGIGGAYANSDTDSN